MQYPIPRVVIAATQSGSGKTTIVTGLLAALRSRGVRVQSYKVGPDYIDPGYHALASGRPAHNLDTWLVPEERLQDIFVRTAQSAELAVIEGVMGLYDGGRRGVSSTAEIARMLKAPVLLVIDAKSMGASAAAIALGFKQYDPEVELAGVILNRLGSPTHEKMIAEALERIGIPLFGAVRRQDSLRMPERHLGLLPVTENEDREIIAAMGREIGPQLELDRLLALARSAVPLSAAEKKPSAQAAAQVRIGVARDEAFSFYYPESLQVLEDAGAQIVPFSPLHEDRLPAVDGLLLGGGFPEMFAEQLQANGAMRRSIREAAEAGMPIYAECGGYMYLMEGLRDFAGERFAMAGVFPGEVQMNKRLQMVGYVEAVLQRDTVLGRAGTVLRGHEFHFSSEAVQPAAQPFTFVRLRNQASYGAGQQRKHVLGSYLHLHFAGCPAAAAAFVHSCAAWREEA